MTAILAALGSALGFALSSSLQHRAAGSAPREVRNALQLLGHLLRQPWWVVGQVLALISFFLHAFALHLGALVVVQPVVNSGIVLAVPFRAALSRRRPPPGEVSAVLVTALGLTVFLVAVGPMESAGSAPEAATALLLMAVGVALAIGAFVAAERSRTAARRAGLCGVAAGILFGLVAGLVKMSLYELEDAGLAAMFSAWSLWLVPVLGPVGVMVNQHAYRVGALSASMPMVNMVNVVVALFFGSLVFGEVPRHTPLALAGEAFGLACLVYGLVRVAEHADQDEVADAAR